MSNPGDVKIRISTTAELQAAQATKEVLEAIVQRTGEADGAAEDYKNTLKALNEAMKASIDAFA